MSGQIEFSQTIFDYQYAGDHTLSSADQNAVTKLNGVAQALPVFIFEAETFQLAYFLISNSDGSWNVNNVNGDFKFLAICRDYTQILNSSCCDWMQPT